jgi:hypothetical protein
MPVFQQHLGGAQHALVLAVRHRRRAWLSHSRRGDDRLHDQAGAEDEPVQPVQIGVEILDRPGGDAAVHRRPWRRPARSAGSAAVEGRRDQVIGPKVGGLAAIGACGDLGRFLAGELGDGLDGGRASFPR